MSKNKKVYIEKFNLNKYNKLIESADDFFEAALRCGFNDSDKLKKYPLMFQILLIEL